MTDRYLLDSNILIYLSNRSAQHRPVAIAAVEKLHAQGAKLSVCSQSIVEMRTVLTRPATSPNGIGMTPVDVKAEIVDYLKVFALQPDGPALFPLWRDLTDAAGTIGKQNHDARLLAAAMAGGCSHLLTFNESDFKQFSAFTTVQIVNPATVLKQ